MVPSGSDNYLYYCGRNNVPPVEDRIMDCGPAFCNQRNSAGECIACGGTKYDGVCMAVPKTSPPSGCQTKTHCYEPGTLCLMNDNGITDLCNGAAAVDCNNGMCVSTSPAALADA